MPLPFFGSVLQATIVLAVWSYWERVIDIDALEKLEMGDTTSILLDESRSKLSIELQQTYKLLHDYGYGYSDDQAYRHSLSQLKAFTDQFYEKITFARLSLDWLSRGTDRLERRKNSRRP